MININPSNYLTTSVASAYAAGIQPAAKAGIDSASSPIKPIEPLPEVRGSGLAERERRPGDEPESPSTLEAQTSTDAGRLQKSVEQKQLERDQREIRDLAARDRDVRNHEQAHAAVGGQYAGAASFQYQRGPDGVRYAVSGEVPISAGRESTPQATIEKMQVVKRAALAPAEPSPQDRRVAAEASRLEMQARAELRTEQARDAQESEDESAQQAQDNDLITPDRLAVTESRSETTARPVDDRDAQNTLPLNSRLNASLARVSLQSREPGSILDQLV